MTAHASFCKVSLFNVVLLQLCYDSSYRLSLLVSVVMKSIYLEAALFNN